MNQLDLTTQNGAVNFRPGEWLEGRATWELDRDVDALEIRLIWFTQGKGDTDVSVVETQTVAAPPRMGSQNFRFRLPDAPYSFSGKLISLLWAVEIVANGIKEAARLDFTLAPEGREIALGTTTAHLSAAELAAQKRAEDLVKKFAEKRNLQP